MVARKPRGKVKETQPAPDGMPARADDLAQVGGPPPACSRAGDVAELNEKLSASSLRMAIVPISQCDLLEKNARFMRVEQYQRLVANVKRDGCLTSRSLSTRLPGTTSSLDPSDRTPTPVVSRRSSAAKASVTPTVCSISMVARVLYVPTSSRRANWRDAIISSSVAKTDPG